jgi:hypothetical protein
MQSAEWVPSEGFAGLRALHSTFCALHSPLEWASCRCRPGAAFLQRKPAGCRKEAIWSQSPVLPWAQRAYETCLSAGSTAMLPNEQEWGPHPELHWVPLPTGQERPERRDHRNESGLNEVLDHVLNVLVSDGSRLIEQVPLSQTT